MSLNQLIRDFLEKATSDSDPGRVAAELEQLWSQDQGASGGWAWNREEIHDRSKLR